MVYSHSGRKRTARRVDIEVDVLIRVLGFKEEHLGHDQRGRGVVDFV
jgi:hypothetical protein